jgi:hypothetical protein
MLKTRQMVPPVAARAADGRVVRAWDYKQKKNLVVAFVHAGCARCEAFVGRLAERAAELAECEAVALVILPEPPPARLTDGLPPQIVVAADISGRSAHAWLGEAVVGAFVADRYGELFAQWCGRDESALPGAGEILSWLGQVQVACEECGVSHWQTD